MPHLHDEYSHRGNFLSGRIGNLSTIYLMLKYVRMNSGNQTFQIKVIAEVK